MILFYILWIKLFRADPLAFSVGKVRQLEKSTPAPLVALLLARYETHDAQEIIDGFQMLPPRG